ncbi:MAG: site-specific DNA-methyltransferase [Phycisphaerae bacterium]|nr:site-specific DNA-methyltransferase [Phycisphaerae bacterium]
MKINKKYIKTLNTALLINGDTLNELPKMESNIIDSCLIDPPYGIGFLGKEWDNFSPKAIEEKVFHHQKIDNKKQSGRSSSMHAGSYDLSLAGARGFQDWCFLWAKELIRVIKPGGHVLCFCSTRMYHRLTVALEEAGFEIRDTLSWNFGSGFPKSKNVALVIDKIMGCPNRGHAIATASTYQVSTGKPLPPGEDLPRYESKTKESKGWNDFGTALKPAMELICLARKPLNEKTVAKNILKWGTGSLNIDGCRIKDESSKELQGRWPANTIFDEEAGKVLDLQSKTNPSRFFYCPKPNNKEKNAGLEGMPKVRRDLRDEKATGVMSKKSVQPQQNSHPTIKPVTLLRYLVRLITPPNGVVLDCFMGSGTCGIATYLEGFKYIGIELEKEYYEIAKKRIQHYINNKKIA